MDVRLPPAWGPDGPSPAGRQGKGAAEEDDGAEKWNVIDDELLAAALCPQKGSGKEGDDSHAAPDTKTDLLDAITEATTLELSFCRLRRIDNLDGFRCLTTLRLDNNGLSTMENLEGLVHLTWLDLSFNRIERIEGLESLRKLTDLSLYHNRIRDAQGLATAACRQLQYLSLGRNRMGAEAIASLAAILQARFPRLEALALQGQEVEAPIASSTATSPGSYPRAAVVAALPRLQFLDHARVHRGGAAAHEKEEEEKTETATAAGKG